MFGILYNFLQFGGSASEYPNLEGGYHMKKFLALALALVMVLGLAACGGTVTTTDTTPAPRTEHLRRQQHPRGSRDGQRHHAVDLSHRRLGQ